MICEACHGRGGIPGIMVCPECQGSGLQHCCEGLRPGNVQSGFFLYSARVELMSDKPKHEPATPADEPGDEHERPEEERPGPAPVAPPHPDEDPPEDDAA